MKADSLSTCPIEMGYFNKRYVLVFAQQDLYDRVNTAILLVRKPDDCDMHAGKFNLPGGKIEVGEAPWKAAIRELKEETGLDGTFPQYVGAIAPEDNGSEFVVAIYRVLVRASQEIVSEEGQPAMWVPLNSLARYSYMSCLPNLAVLIPLISTGMRNFVLKEDLFTQPQHSMDLAVPSFIGDQTDTCPHCAIRPPAHIAVIDEASEMDKELYAKLMDDHAEGNMDGPTEELVRETTG